jgi:Ankyrin repeat
MPRTTVAPFGGDFLLSEVYTTIDRSGPFRESRETPAQQVERFEKLRSECPAIVQAIFEAGFSLVKHAADGDLEELHELILELRGDEITLHHPRAALYAAVIKGNLHIAEYLRRRGLPIVRAHDRDPGTNLYEQMILNWIEEQEERREIVSTTTSSGEDSDAASFIDRTAKEIVQRGELWRWCLHLHDPFFAAATTKLHFPDGPKDFLPEPPRKRTAGVEHKESTSALVAAVASESAEAEDDEEKGGTSKKAGEAAVGAEEEKQEQEEEEEEISVVPSPVSLSLAYIASVLQQPVDAMRKHDGYTPLHLVAEAGWPEAVAALLLLGADVHAVSSSSDSDTPLSAAIRGRKDTCCDAILEAAAAAPPEDSESEKVSAPRDARLAGGRGRGGRSAGGSAPRPTAEEVALAKQEKRRYDMTEALLRYYGGVKDWKIAMRRGNERYERRQMAASLAKLAAGGLSSLKESYAGPVVTFSAASVTSPVTLSAVGAGAAAAKEASGAGGKRNFTLSTSAVISMEGGVDAVSTAAVEESLKPAAAGAGVVGTATATKAKDASTSTEEAGGFSSFSGGFNPESVKRAYAAAAMNALKGGTAK